MKGVNKMIRGKIRILDWSNDATREARKVFAAAGFLSTTWDNLDNSDKALNEQTACLTERRFWQAARNGNHEIFRLPPGSPTISEMIDEERSE